MMEWVQIIGSVITVAGTVIVAVLTVRATKETARRKEIADKEQSRIDGEAELREDLIKVLADTNARNNELVKINQEQQAFIDQERTKRRMQEMENDHLARKMSRLEEENKTLLRKIQALEQELQQIKNGS